MRRASRQAGFTLIELLIVMEIIAVLTVLAMPHVLRAKMNANETSAVGSLRTMLVGQASYRAAVVRDDNGDGDGDYGDLAALANPQPALGLPGYIGDDLAAGTKSGYLFAVATFPGTNAAPPAFTIVAFPERPMQSGVKQYWADESNVIRVTSDGTPVGPDSLPLQ